MSHATPQIIAGDPARPPAAESYGCTVTSYAGVQGRVLEVRNANRSVPQPQSYLDWRYETPGDAPEPKIFWLNAPSGDVVGMAAVIFRQYWLGSRRMYVPVVGDISVDSRLRGKGLGRLLLDSLTRYLSQHYSDRPALVIPTESARRSLAALGWVTAGRLVPHVFLIDPGAQLRGKLKSAALSRSITAAYRRCMTLWLRRKALGAECLEDGGQFDATFDELWQRRLGSGSMQRDMSAASLEWRYARHPNHRFHVVKLLGQRGLQGFIVYELLRELAELSIHDLFVVDPQLLPGFLAAFLLRHMQEAQVKAVRLTLSDTHSYRTFLHRLGFVPRPADAVVFQALYPANAPANAAGSWSMTFGDKDI